QIARLNRITDGQGVLVRELTEASSPAGTSGLRSGDVIVSINGQPVKNVRELIRKIAALPVGSMANIGYVRAGERLTANVKLEERKDETSDRPDFRSSPERINPKRTPEKKEENPDESKSRATKSGMGINVKTLTPELARNLGLEGAKGAFV